MRRTRSSVALLLTAAFTLGVGASGARSAARGQVTISMLALTVQEPGYEVLIANFERVYPNITVDASYLPPGIRSQIETTELAAGDAPDLLPVNPGCGSAVSVCALAPAGDLAPLVKEPWVKRSLPLVTSLDKYGQGLFAYTPDVSPEGVFTNDSLFGKLGLNVPRTFPQLLTLCRQAKADGTAALILDGATSSDVSSLIEDLAVATVYGQDKQWPAELKAGKTSFDGTPGWQQALQNFIDMNNAGCFQAGVTGTTLASSEAEFAQGQGLMIVGLSSFKGAIDALDPQFGYSFHSLPGGTDPDQTTTFINLATSVGVNARSSAQNQAAAQTFIDFIARPKQNALYAQILGGLTQYEFLKNQIPSFMSTLTPVITQHQYVINPAMTWWNANVVLALNTDGVGLITGQESIDEVLNAMDAAWQQGPS